MTTAPKTAYPLSWPPGRVRTKQPVRNKLFKLSFADARDTCQREIQLLGATDAVFSTNIPLKRDGLPMSVKWGETIAGDSGVAVYFKRKGKELCFACDKWTHVQDNMRAISLTIEALRGIARWGTGDMMEAAFTGFLAIPERTSGTNWWETLGVPVNASKDQVEEAFRFLAKKHHPDRGGDSELFIRLNEAYRQAMQLHRAA